MQRIAIRVRVRGLQIRPALIRNHAPCRLGVGRVGSTPIEPLLRRQISAEVVRLRGEEKRQHHSVCEILVQELEYVVLAAAGIVEDGDVDAGSHRGCAGGDGRVVGRWDRGGGAGK